MKKTYTLREVKHLMDISMWEAYGVDHDYDVEDQHKEIISRLLVEHRPKQRKFKNLITLYCDYDSDGESISTEKPSDKDAQYIFARKGSIFILQEEDFGVLENTFILLNKKLGIILKNLDEINYYIKEGWFKEIK